MKKEHILFLSILLFLTITISISSTTLEKEQGTITNLQEFKNHKIITINEREYILFSDKQIPITRGDHIELTFTSERFNNKQSYIVEEIKKNK